jgi:hypothetical protein
VAGGCQILYFLIDLTFLSVVRPLRRRIMAMKWIRRPSEWVDELNRYAALMLLLVPWLILEPIKPIGFSIYALYLCGAECTIPMRQFGAPGFGVAGSFGDGCRKASV